MQQTQMAQILPRTLRLSWANVVFAHQYDAEEIGWLYGTRLAHR